MEGFEVVPTALSILVVLAVLAGTLMVMRWATGLRVGGVRRDRHATEALRIVERHSMGRSGALVVMRYGGREHVLGVTESSITHIAEGTIDLRDRNDEEEAEHERRSSSAVARGIERLREKTVRH